MLGREWSADGDRQLAQVVVLQGAMSAEETADRHSSRELTQPRDAFTGLQRAARSPGSRATLREQGAAERLR